LSAGEKVACMTSFVKTTAHILLCERAGRHAREQEVMGRLREEALELVIETAPALADDAPRAAWPVELKAVLAALPRASRWLYGFKRAAEAPPYGELVDVLRAHPRARAALGLREADLSAGSLRQRWLRTQQSLRQIGASLLLPARPDAAQAYAQRLADASDALGQHLWRQCPAAAAGGGEVLARALNGVVLGPSLLAAAPEIVEELPAELLKAAKAARQPIQCIRSNRAIVLWHARLHGGALGLRDVEVGHGDDALEGRAGEQHLQLRARTQGDARELRLV
jgi:hypothetical protein